MYSQSKRHLLVVFLTFLVIFEMVAYVTTTPRPREQFFQLYILGANRLLSDYYPNNDPNIGVGDLVRWHVGVTDSMGSVQLVVIRIKLANQTIRPPDDLQAQPSPAPLITEFRRFIQDNETWEIPFDWSISDAVNVDGSTRIQGLDLNGESMLLDSLARSGYNFRFIFELWTWQVDSGAFQFGWWAGAERRVAWLQIWFNMTRSVKTESQTTAYPSENSPELSVLSSGIAAPVAGSKLILAVNIQDPEVPHEP